MFTKRIDDLNLSISEYISERAYLGEWPDQGILFPEFNIVISGPQRENGKLSALGEKGWIEIVQKCPELKNIKIPHQVVVTLPTLFDDFGVIEVPELRYHCGCPEKLSFSIKRC